LGEYHTPEEIRQAIMHATNNAFERYFHLELEDVRAIDIDTGLTPKSGYLNKGKIFEFKGKVGAEGGIRIRPLLSSTIC
jgi:hypothetical protein